MQFIASKRRILFYFLFALGVFAWLAPSVSAATCTITCRQDTRNENIDVPSVATEAACTAACESRCGPPRECGGIMFQPDAPAEPSPTLPVTTITATPPATTPAAQTPTVESQAPQASSLQTPHDPFGGRSIPAIVSGVIRSLLGIAGALFLAMFVYGGAIWLTAGSSDRTKQAQTTLTNAVIGVFVVILSYTLVGSLLRFAGSLGADQTGGADQAQVTACYDTCLGRCTTDAKTAADPSGPGFSLCQQRCRAECPSAPSAAGEGGNAPSDSGAGFFQNLIRSGGVTINGSGDVTAGPTGGTRSSDSLRGASCSPETCRAACPTNCGSSIVSSALSVAGYSQEQCLQGCNLICGRVCDYVHTPAECSPGCHRACSYAPDVATLCEGFCVPMCEQSLFP